MQALFPSYFSVKLDGEDLSGGSRNSSLAVQTDPFLWPSIGFSEVQVFEIDLGLMNHNLGKNVSLCLLKKLQPLRNFEQLPFFPAFYRTVS